MSGTIVSVSSILLFRFTFSTIVAIIPFLIIASYKTLYTPEMTNAAPDVLHKAFITSFAHRVESKIKNIPIIKNEMAEIIIRKK